MNTTRTLLKRDKLAEYARFGATGILNTAVDLLAFNLLILSFGTNLEPRTHATLKAVAFCAAVTNSYLLNKYWVFRHVQARTRGKASHHIGEGGKFLAVSIAGFFINVTMSTVAFYVLATRTGLLSPHLAANVGAAIGAAFTLISNYFGYSAFVFKRNKQHEARKEYARLRGDTGIQRIQADTPNSR